MHSAAALTVRARVGRAPRVVAAMVGLAMLAAAGSVVAAAPARAEARTLSVTPSAELGNEVVRVAWTGFTPTLTDGTYGVIVLQCRANPTRLGDCFTANTYPDPAEGNRLGGVTAADGTGSVLFEVRPAANLPELACAQSTPCSILVYENDGVPVGPDDLPPSAVVAPVEFARSRADCPDVTDFDVRADGAASAAPAFYRWAAQRCLGNDALVLDYTETSSTSGRENFLNGLVDLGITSLPATDDELESHSEHPEFAYAPVDMTAITVVINMKDPATGRRLENVVLSPRLVARLVTNSDLSTFLVDRELRELNPGVRFPTATLSPPLLRAERSAATQMVTSWMVTSKDARDFLAGADKHRVPRNPAWRDQRYPTDAFANNSPEDDQFQPRTGQRTVGLRMFYGVRPAGTVPERTEIIGFIGIVDLPTAQRFGLPAAKIVNAAGAAVAPTDDSVRAGFELMRRTRAGTLVPAYDAADPDGTPDGDTAERAYPLVKVDYAMVPTQLDDDDKADQIRGLLEYIATEGQDDLPAGYFALPDALREQTLAVADRIQGPAAPTTTTTTVAPPTDTPPIDFGSSGDPGPFFSGDSTGGGTATPPASTDGDDGGAETPIATREIAALATTGAPLTLPALLALGGIALLGWAASGAVPAVRRVVVRVRRGTTEP
ncbi:MAG TPA: substrate-binding domain-containing protein [Acidimicrobiia bacterium]|nr:substrate-binding domain-containing protein [Acidimicrobiia bacterium]